MWRKRIVPDDPIPAYTVYRFIRYYCTFTGSWSNNSLKLLAIYTLFSHRFEVAGV